MRFVSPYPGFKVRVIPQEVEQLANGLSRVKKPGFFAEFSHGDYTDYEKAAAYDRFGAEIRKGQRMDADMISPTDMDWRIGTFDTASIEDEEMRRRVETLMSTDPRNVYGLGRDYIQVEAPTVPPPWPRYDEIAVKGRRTIEHVVEIIVDRVRDLGLDVEATITYERLHENRPEVIRALEAIETETDEPVVAA